MANIRRILRNVPATLPVTLVDSDGAPREAVGDVTVTAVRSNGEALFTDRLADPGIEYGEFVTELATSDTGELDRLTLTWAEAGGGVYTTYAEVVGGYYFSPDEARTAAPGLTDASKYPTALILDARNEVEQEAERITGRAFVPRFRRVTLDASEFVRLPDVDVRRVRSMTVGGRTAPVTVGAMGQLYPLLPSQVANAGPRYLPWGRGEVVVDYEYGLDEPPADLKRAALIRLVDRLGLAKSGVPSRNEYQIIDGQAFTVTQPGVRGSLTGIREVDAVYAAYAVARDVMAVRIGG